MNYSTGELAARAYKGVTELKKSISAIPGFPDCVAVPTQNATITGSGGSSSFTIPAPSPATVSKARFVVFDVTVAYSAPKTDTATIDTLELIFAQTVAPGPLPWVNLVNLEVFHSAGDARSSVNFRVYAIIDSGVTAADLEFEVSATTAAPGDYGNLSLTVDAVVTTLS